MAGVAWIVVQLADMSDYVEEKVISAFSAKDLSPGQANPFTNLRNAVCNRIRGDIQRHYIVSATDYSVPPSLKWIACLLIAEMMQGRLTPTDKTNFLEAHTNNLKDARERLAEIRSGDLDVETPLDPATETSQGTGGAELVTSTVREATRETLDGLI